MTSERTDFPHLQEGLPLVAVVVLNWNGLADTEACVRSLLAQAYPTIEIHVVDNASEGKEADTLHATFGHQIRLHRNKSNLGFAGGCNTALRIILRDGRAELAALLNNDAEALPDWVGSLVEAARQQPGAAIFASKMVFHDQPAVIENAGISLLTNGDAVPRGRGKPAEDYAESAEVLGGCGGAVLYRTCLLAEIGLFHEEFFANFEDVDLSLRALAQGHRCRYVPSAVVRHHLSRSIAKARNEDFHVRSLRNLAVACWVNLPWQVLLLNLPWILLRESAVMILAPLLGQRQVARIARRARHQTLSERTLIRARRRALAPNRRGSWVRIWWKQRSFLPAYWRFFVEAIVLRRRGFLE